MLFKAIVLAARRADNDGALGGISETAAAAMHEPAVAPVLTEPSGEVKARLEPTTAVILGPKRRVARGEASPVEEMGVAAIIHGVVPGPLWDAVAQFHPRIDRQILRAVEEREVVVELVLVDEFSAVAAVVVVVVGENLQRNRRRADVWANGVAVVGEPRKRPRRGIRRRRRRILEIETAIWDYHSRRRLRKRVAFVVVVTRRSGDGVERRRRRRS